MKNDKDMSNNAEICTTSDVWPSRIVTSRLGIALDKVAGLVEISIGSGPVLHISAFNLQILRKKLRYK